MAAATSATPECRCATSRPSARTRSIQPVSALRVDHLGLVEQVEHEALVGGAALDDTVVSAIARRSRASASSRVAAVGDDLGDHRVEVGRDRVALADAGVDADARARRAARAARCGPGTGRSRGRGPRR